MDLRRHERRGHSKPHPDPPRKTIGLAGRRHIANRSGELRRGRRGEGLPARRRRRDAGHIAARQQRTGGAQVHAAEHHAAPGPALRSHGRAHHPAQPVEQIAAGHQAQRPGPEHHPSGARGGSRRRGSLSLRRQAARDHGRPGFPGPAGARSVRVRREHRPAAPERHSACGRREDRGQGLHPDDEQLAERHRGHQCISHQASRRPHRLHARCGARSRWVPGADQFGVGQRHTRRLDDDPQDRRSVHPGRDRRGARGAEGHQEGAARRASRSKHCSTSRCS